MQPLFIDYSLKNKTIAVAVSGGEDSMALLNYVLSVKDKYSFNLVCINVEHGIRGKSSENDSLFVKNFCNQYNIPFIFYQVDSLEKAEKDKLSVEQAARTLRYQCFFDAIKNHKCDLIFTAHHLKDNMESVLINIFRGTGIKGLSGVTNYDDKILRPFLNVSKKEISDYVRENKVPFVTDETNLNDDYTRNFIRHNVIPSIEKIFPEAEKSVYRLSEIARSEDRFLDEEAKRHISFISSIAEIKLPLDKVLLNRATVICLKKLGIERDYEQVHVNDVCALLDKETGKSVDLPKNVVATKEYDKIVFYKKTNRKGQELPFKTGKFTFFNKEYSVTEVPGKPLDLKSGLFVDKDKIPAGALIRSRSAGDYIKKFGGGTKLLSDFYSDFKIPRKERDLLPVIAIEKRILAIFGIAVSLDVKVDKETKIVLQLQ